MAFNHENLRVYQRTLTFNSKVSAWTSQWDSKHAIGDQLSRAAGSMLENIAMASASFSAIKTRSLDYSIGSSLECAACLDLAHIKRLLAMDLVYSEKEELSQILRMLVGLKKSWAKSTMTVREDNVKYSTGDGGNDKVGDTIGSHEPLFHHETLNVYRAALAAAEAFYSSETLSQLSNPIFRRLDELLTSMVLNIAEGNGRFSDADQTRFLATSHQSAVKLAARLDLCVTQGFLSRQEVGEWKIFLEKVCVITSSMARSEQL